jgi:hypothetical protein
LLNVFRATHRLSSGAQKFYKRLWLPAAVMAEFPLSHDSCRQPQTYVKPETAITVFELLMMSGVSLETR